MPVALITSFVWPIMTGL